MYVIVQKKYVPLMLLRAHRTEELRVNMLKGIIKMDIKEITLKTKQTERN